MRTQGFPTFFLSLFFLLGFSSGFAQQTQIYVDKDAAFRKGQELFEKQKYAEAQASFNEVIELYATDRNALTLIDAEFYAATCAMELFNKDAEALFEKFLADHPESPKVHRAWFNLAKINYRQKQWQKSIDWFNQVDIFDLTQDEQYEFYFKRGYDYFELNRYADAKKDFFEIRDIDTKYSPAANYYYSHILYTEGNYETALQGFQRLVHNEAFGPVVPYYIAQIYYLQGKYDDVIKYAPPLLDSAKRAAEISRIIGESYYRTGRYAEAIPYLERFHNTGNGYTRGDVYELGYAYYKTGKYAEAITGFQDAIAGVDDTLSQNAWYHLADCYVRTGDKSSARTAFGKASAMTFDPKIREDALFSYAKLSYELSYSPFNEAIVALQKYINEFPNSSRRDEVNSFLVNVYLSTKNYKEALAAIGQIKVIGPTLQPAYQQICYNRAVELFNNGEYDEAITYFDKTLKYPVNKQLNALAKYWKGDALYIKGQNDKTKYDEAITQYKAFLYEPGAVGTPQFNTVNYSLGYAYHMKAINNSLDTTIDVQDFNDAAVSFRKFITNKSNDEAGKFADAYLRLADDYFMLRFDKPQRDKALLNAIDFYSQAYNHTASSGPNKEYALFHKALAYGLIGKKQEKADELKKLIDGYPNSAFLVNARLLQAQAYFDLGQYQNALDGYQKVLSANPDNNYTVPCMRQMALIYYQQHDFTNALEYYKQVGVKAKGTTSGFDASRMVKNIYVARGEVDEWEKWADANGYAESTSAADSTLYGVIKKQFVGNQCDDVVKNAERYISKYSSGNFIIDVHYMKAECQYKAKDYTNALTSYVFILDKPKGDYTERAASVASYIYDINKDYVNAAKYYDMLEKVTTDGVTLQNTRINLLRCYLFTSKFDTGTVYAEKVIGMTGLSDPLTYAQAYYVRGRHNYNHGNNDLAIADFNNVAKKVKNDLAAESKYYVCEIQYAKREYKTNEKALFKMITDYSFSKQWKGKAMLLLSDNYLAQRDTFNAKYILKDYVQNGEVEDLRKQAQQKLDLLDATQNNTRIRKPEDDIIVPIDNKPGENNSPEPQDGSESEPPKEGGGQ